MLFDDSIQSLAYSISKKEVSRPKVNDIFQKPQNTKYLDANLSIICVDKPAKNLKNTNFKIFMWIWEKKGQTDIDFEINDILKNEGKINYAPTLSFIVDETILDCEYRRVAGMIPNNIIPSPTDFCGELDKIKYIDEVRKKILYSL